MPGFVIDEQVVDVATLRVRSFRDDASLRLRMGEDGRARYTRWVRSIVLHTTKGIPGGKDHRPQQILPGFGPSTKAGENTARFWSTEKKQAGAHLVVDFDGSITCLADLQTEVAFHAGEVNEVSIGIEIFQGSNAQLYEEQLQTVVRLVDFLTLHFGIQRQIPPLTSSGIIARMAAGGQNVVGIYGHRHVTTNRGPGDPGDAVFERLRDAGYEELDFASSQDLTVWKQRQHEVLDLDLDRCDGIAGPATVALLQTHGHQDGLWVTRPPFADNQVARSETARVG